MSYKNYPIKECMKTADRILRENPTAKIFQKFSCSHCGQRLQMPDANAFYEFGNCDQCGKQTNIQQTGCNYSVHYTVGGDGSDGLADLLDELTSTTRHEH